MQLRRCFFYISCVSIFFYVLIRSLYQLKGRSQQNKVGFLHPELITPDVYGANRGATLDYLARALEGYEFYVAPYLQGYHALLFLFLLLICLLF